MKYKWKSVACRERGFTLLESLLAIIVIGMLAVIAVPRLLSTDKQVVHIAARKIMSSMRYARSLAITKSEDHIVRFYPKGDNLHYDSYDVLRGSDVVKSEVIDDNVDCVTPGDGVNAWDITFTPLGSASIGGEPIITLTLGSHQENISVTMATGRVYLQ